MRRITMWALSTLSALVLLFSYHTSTSSSAAGVVALGAANAGSGGAGSAGSGSSGGATSTPTPSRSATSGTGSSSSSSGSGSSGSSGSGSSGSGSSSGSSGSGSSSGSSGGSSSGTYAGAAVMTQFGPVQVQITVSNGSITKSVVTQVPWSSGRDQQINSYAVPILNQEVVQAQSSSIDMVSGATFTSEGYIQSLQSAIDQANL